MTKAGMTANHLDDEAVILIPTYGKVIYNIYVERVQESFFLGEGDLLLIPKNIEHSAIPLGPRIVLSTGVFHD
jgi:cupin superfamily acireductone dioxygenase involved in methionine salvage